MKFLRFLVALGLGLVVVTMNAATFKVINAGNNAIAVKPEWRGEGGACYTKLMPGASKDYDSGFYTVTSFRWIQEYPQTIALLPGHKDVKMFQADLNIPFATLGAEVTFLNDGSYTFKRNFA